MTEKTKLAKALLKLAADMQKVGLLDRATFDKIAMRHTRQSES
jgi:lipopolysaccharide biosynthesis regulator YciM